MSSLRYAALKIFKNWNGELERQAHYKCPPSCKFMQEGGLLVLFPKCIAVYQSRDKEVQRIGNKNVNV